MNARSDSNRNHLQLAVLWRKGSVGSGGTGAAATSTQPRPTIGQRPPTIDALTGLRFVAALWVVFYHYHLYVTAFPEPLTLVTRWGHAGVSLFYLLSGFVLVYNYHLWFPESLARSREFWVARFARVYPIHLVMLLVMTPVFLFNSGGTLSPLVLGLSWFSHLTLTQTAIPFQSFLNSWNEPNWSVSCEAAFYLSFPFFMRFVLSRCRSWRALIALTGTLLLGGFVAQLAVIPLASAFPNVAIGKAPYVRIWEFLIGCSAATLYMKAHAEGWPLRGERFRTVAIAVLIAAILITPHAVGLLPHIGNAVTATTWTVLFALLILTLAWGESAPQRMLASRWMVLLGEASYSLYMIHFFPIALLGKPAWFGQPEPVAFSLMVIVITVGVSLISYRLIETPARQTLRSAWKS